MAIPTKTQGTSLLSIQALANNTILTSTASDVSTVFSATIFVHIGRDVVTALTLPVNIRVQASAKSSANDEWFTLPAGFVQTGVAVAASSTLAASGNSAAANPITSTGGSFTQSDGDLCFIKNGTLGNSEFVRAGHIVTTSMPLFDALTRTQNSATIYNKAEEFVFSLGPEQLLALGRIRVTIDTLGTGQAVNVESYLVTCDSIS